MQPERTHELPDWRPVSQTSAAQSSPAWTLALTSVAFFLVMLGLLVVITALPAIHKDLGGSISTLGWILNAYGLIFAVGILPAAAIGDRLGRVRVLTLGLGIFTAASAACAVSQSVESLIAARAVQGLGAAMVMPVSLTILITAFSPQHWGRVIGAWGGIGGLAAALGPLVGGAVTQGLDWHWVFWISVPIGIVVTVLSLLRLTESRGPATKLDLPAVVLVSLGLLGVGWGLVRGNDVGWGSSEVVGAFTVGILLVAAFVIWEHRASQPMLPMRLFGSLTFVGANGASFFMFASLLSAAFIASQYFQLVLHNSPFDTGLRILPWTAAPFFIAPAAGAVSDRIGKRPVMFAGLVLQGIGLSWFAYLATTHVDYGQLVLPFVLAGVGISMALSTAPAAALGAVSPRDLGKASGVNSTLQRLGGVFGVAIATVVFTSNGHLGTAASFDSGFRPAMVSSAGLSIVGAVFAMAVRSRRSRDANDFVAEPGSVAANR